MADQGAILFDKRVVKVNGFIDLIYDYKKGFLHSFVVEETGVKYIHLIESDARKSSLEMYQQKIPKGYYSEITFFEYRFDKNKLNELLLTKYDNNFKVAEIGDIINVKKIQLFSPYVAPEFEFGNYESYTLTYNGQSLVDNLGNIVPPVIPFIPIVTSMNLGPIAKAFYSNNIQHNSEGATNQEKYLRALAIASTSIYIDNIISFLYPLFENNVTEFYNLKNNQDDFWQTNIFTSPVSYTDIVNYENAIYNFFRNAYQNKLKIQKAKGYEKLYWLTLGMSVNTLTILTAINKITLILWLLDNVRMGQRWLFLNDNEGLILKIVNSVTQQQSDEFLLGLFSYQEHMNKNIFERLTDEQNLFVNNTVDDSNFLGIGEDNRYVIMTTLYTIWKASSYNPYQNGSFSQTNLDNFIYTRDKLGTNPDPNDSFFDFINASKFDFSASPISLNYISDSSSGYYIDNFYFYATNNENDDYNMKTGWFNDFKDFSNFNEKPKNKVLAIQKNYRKSGKDGLYGTYDYLQPVSLISSDQTAAINIPVINGDNNPSESNINSLIPMFFLKYIDDKNRQSNINTSIGYFIDVVSLFAGGYGAVTKIKHLRTLSGFTPEIIAGTEYGTTFKVYLYAATGLETINFSAASLSLFFKIITNSANANAPWLKDLKEKVMWIEIFSGTASVLAEGMIRRTSKKIVDSFNTNGWPDEFVSDSRGTDAVESLGQTSGLANEINEALFNQFKPRIIQNVTLKVQNNNLFSFLDEFGQPLHSQTGIDDIIRQGFNKGLPLDEIEGLFFISYRIEKRVNTTELLQQIENWKFIRNRKFPYKFNSIENFETFKARLRTSLNDFGIPIDDVRLQGSSLRNPTAKDIDVAIFIQDDKYDSLIKKIRQEIIDRNKDHIAKKLLKQFDKDAKDGFIRSFYFPRKSINNSERSFMNWFRDTINGMETSLTNDIDITIIKKGKKLDNPPYFKI